LEQKDAARYREMMMTDKDTRKRYNTDPDAIKDNEPRERRLSRPDSTEEEEFRARKDGDWFNAIGPEDEDPDVIQDGLEQYGFDKFDVDDLVSLPSAAPMGGLLLDNGDDPDEVGDELYATLVDADDNLSFRPLEDLVIEELDGDDDDFDADDPEDDLNFPQPRDLD
jgi:hypothetical protein